MKRKRVIPFDVERGAFVKSEVIVALRELLKEFYPDFNRQDSERMDEILEAIPREDFRREHFICALDQAYCEARSIERRLTLKDFVQ